MENKFLLKFAPWRPGNFRLFLSLLVFVHHSSSFGLGKYAVYVFFVLSGFWVETMWRERYCQSRSPYWTYVVSRCWRLIPSFFLIGCIVVLLELLIGVPWQEFEKNNIVHLFFSSAFILGYNSLNFLPVGPGWSLDIEMQYYFIAPLLSVLATGRLKTAMFFLLLLISLIAGFGFPRPNLLNYLFFFFVGLYASKCRWAPSKRLAFLSSGISSALVIIIAASPLRGALFGGSAPSELFVWNPLVNIVCAVGFIPFAIYTTTQESDSTDRRNADLSYIIYLLHWPVFIWTVFVGGSPMHRLPYFIVGWVGVIFLSFFIWKFFDKPVNIARARWVSTRLRATSGKC